MITLETSFLQKKLGDLMVFFILDFESHSNVFDRIERDPINLRLSIFFLGETSVNTAFFG